LLSRQQDRFEEIGIRVLSRFQSHRSRLTLGILVVASFCRAHAQTGSARTQINESGASTTSSVPGKAENGPGRFDLQPGEDPENRLISPFLKHLAGDQKQFWTFPTRLQVKDLKWIAPSVGVIGAFIASDSWWAKQVPASHISTSKTISDYGAYSLIGLGGASFLLGQINHSDHLSETGLLAGEAAIDSTAVAYAFKEVTQRQRPYQDHGNGTFFAGGSSFPSEHSAIAWSIASIWAHEYPGWFSQAGAYGLASAITMTRVTAKQHFPSDAIIGSLLGWYFGREVYRAHHDPEVGGSGWGNFIKDDQESQDKTRNPNYMASPYVPLDSWIYPAMERLIALGYVHSPVLGMRPWTRMQCATLLEDAPEKLGNVDVGDVQAAKLYSTLRDEFGTEITRLEGASNTGMRLDSIYSRTMGISGTPLRDGYHFGETITNDYGRPYWEGINNVTGVEADAEAGPASFYVRGEYQHAPAMPSYSPQVLNAVAAADDFTPALPNGTAAYNRFQLLDSMASFNVNNVQISVGNQSEWLGPGESGPWLMSDNAPPFPTVKIDDIAPHDIPGLSRILGPMRAEFFIGQLSGQRWELCEGCPKASNPFYPNIGPDPSPQPFIHGEKISFQPTPNFEFGMGITAMFGGPGLPVTFGNFFRTYYAHSPTAANNPGKRISAADLTYRVPPFRDWLTFYFDSLVVDEVSPIGSTRANVNPGIYLPKVPKISKLQIRAEGFNESRTTEFNTPGFVYLDARRYRSGYTNDGFLLGSWIGRAGRGGQGWVTYWLSPRNKLQLGYRLQTVDPKFIPVTPGGPGGGRTVDYSAQTEFLLHNVGLSGLLQYEEYRFPVISPVRQSDVTASIQITYYPKWRSRQ
jgi:membrane-associated phospholipid phosphatase